MSDARNSSNNIRGGGSKQTGGSGRTNKYANGTNKTELLGQMGLQASAERSDAKRKLQLQLSSKQLAATMRAALLGEHTEEEYAAYEIPLPSTEDAKAKLKAMKEFTEKWYDKDFRVEWLQTVTEVWLEEIKAKFEAAVKAAMAARNPSKPQEEGEAVSIEELEEMIANLDPSSVSSEERQRLKKKLKSKKKKARDKEKAKMTKKEDSTAVSANDNVVASPSTSVNADAAAQECTKGCCGGN